MIINETRNCNRNDDDAELVKDELVNEFEKKNKIKMICLNQKRKKHFK